MLLKYFEKNILNAGSRGCWQCSFELMLLKYAKFCFDLINSNDKRSTAFTLLLFFFFPEKDQNISCVQQLNRLFLNSTNFNIPLEMQG